MRSLFDLWSTLTAFCWLWVRPWYDRVVCFAFGAHGGSSYILHSSPSRSQIPWKPCCAFPHIKAWHLQFSAMSLRSGGNFQSLRAQGDRRLSTGTRNRGILGHQNHDCAITPDKIIYITYRLRYIMEVRYIIEVIFTHFLILSIYFSSFSRKYFKWTEIEIISFYCEIHIHPSDTNYFTFQISNFI